jgi:hypothetical protein
LTASVLIAILRRLLEFRSEALDRNIGQRQ